MLKNTKKIVLSALLGVLIVGCGEEPVVVDTPLFPDVSEAPATLTTGEQLANAGAFSAPSTPITPLNAVSQSNNVNVTKAVLELSNRVVDSIKGQRFDAALNAVQSVNQSQACPAGGTFSMTGTQDQVSSTQIKLNVTAKYTNCNLSTDVRMNGEMKMVADIDSLNGSQNISIEYVSDFTQNIGVLVLKYFKGSTMSLAQTSSETILGMSVKMQFDSVLIGYQNYEMVLDSSNSSYYQTKGRYYINNMQAYVDYDETYDMSQTPVTTAPSGAIRFKFANGAKILLTILTNTSVKVQLDNEGDGIYDEEKIVTAVF